MWGQDWCGFGSLSDWSESQIQKAWKGLGDERGKREAGCAIEEKYADGAQAQRFLGLILI